MAKKSEETGAPKRTAAAPDPEVTLETTPKARKSRAKSKEPEAEAKAPRKKAAAPAAKANPAAKAKPTAAKTRKAKIRSKDETGEPLEVPPSIVVPIEDPIGDVSSGEARFSLSDAAEPESLSEMAAYRADTADDALEGTLENRAEEPAATAQAELKETGFSPHEKAATPAGALAPEASPSPIESDTDEADGTNDPAGPRPPAQLERLQKILSRAGIASRRHAEEMIEAGRVMVNGQVVAQLGAKADPARDHIRVDGKLIAGAERHRYFVLNKPRGYVTTVSDPEGRPTVMQFFSKMSERLYPIGRLDYDSEGLLLVTNDGELANQLTRAASGVEKTYLVKVAGQPTEEELDMLRSGVPIEHGKPGSDQVHTSPAQIHQIRQGDSPWYEVVLVEGRNRELRKMFEQVGHFVEKIRRVGYGPLVLDLEPGKLRELSPEEVSVLRLAAEGKWKPRRSKTSKMPPREAGRPAQQPGATNFAQRGARDAGNRGAKGPEQRGATNFGQRSSPQPPRGERPFREKPGWKPRDERSGARRDEPRPFRGRPGFDSGPGTRSAGRGFTSAPQPRRPEPNFGNAPRPSWGKPPAPAHGDGAGRAGQRPAFKRHDQPNKGFDKPRARNFGERPVRDFENKPPRRFNQPRGENRTGRPGKTWDRDGGPRPARSPAQSPARTDGSAPAFRGKFKPAFRPAPGGRPAPEGRERPASGPNLRGAAPGPRGFAPGRFSKPGGNRFGFKGKPGGAKRGGPPSGGKRPGGRKRG